MDLPLTEESPRWELCPSKCHRFTEALHFIFVWNHGLFGSVGFSFQARISVVRYRADPNPAAVQVSG